MHLPFKLFIDSLHFNLYPLYIPSQIWVVQPNRKTPPNPVSQTSPLPVHPALPIKANPKENPAKKKHQLPSILLSTFNKNPPPIHHLHLLNPPNNHNKIIPIQLIMYHSNPISPPEEVPWTVNYHKMHPVTSILPLLSVWASFSIKCPKASDSINPISKKSSTISKCTSDKQNKLFLSTYSNKPLKSRLPKAPKRPKFLSSHISVQWKPNKKTYWTFFGAKSSNLFSKTFHSYQTMDAMKLSNYTLP